MMEVTLNDLEELRQLIHEKYEDLTPLEELTLAININRNEGLESISDSLDAIKESLDNLEKKLQLIAEVIS